MCDRYEYLIKKHAGKCFRLSNRTIPYPEIEQEAYLIAYNALASWLPEKGHEPSWVEYNLKSRLGRFLKKHNPSPICETNDEEFGIEDFGMNNTFDPERIAIVKNYMENLSDDAKQMLKLILKDDAPTKLGISTNSSARAIRGSLFKFFEDTIPQKRRLRAMKEIKEIPSIIGEHEAQ